MSTQVVFEFHNYLLYKYEDKGGKGFQNFVCNGYSRTDISRTNPVTVFVRSTLGGKPFFMDALAFGDGLDEQKRKEYWNDRGSGKKPFVLYEPNGSVSQVDTTPIWKVPSTYTSFENWNKQQKAAWLAFVQRVCETPTLRPLISADNFLDPFKNKYLVDSDLYITPRNAPAELLILDCDDLKNALKSIVPNATFCTFNDLPAKVVDKKRQLEVVLIGVNFFNLFWMWVKKDKYRNMWSKFGITTLSRPLPTEAQAQQVNIKMKGENLTKRQSRDKNHELSVQIFQSKIVQRQHNSTAREYEGEETMGISASKISDIFWKNSSARADWLHRIDVMFAIASPASGPRLEQNKSNFVFGTYESNRDMLRAELAAKDYLGQYAASIQDSDTPVVINTVNYRTGTVDRINVDGSRTRSSIPDWVEKQRYTWLSFRLFYSFYHKVTKDNKISPNLAMNAFLDFDPFSRYRPLMKEVDMDYAVMEALFNKYPATSEATIAEQQAKIDDNSKTSTTGTEYTATESEVTNLFGNSTLKANLTTYKPKDSSVGGSAEKATLKDVSCIVLSSVFPSLGDTLFNSISFENITFFHQTVYFTPSKQLGWHFSADLVLNDSCSSLHTVLSKVLFVDKTRLSITSAFGTKGGWTTPFNAHSFTVQGEFPGLSLTPPGIDWLKLTSIGAGLFGVRGLQWDSSSNPTSALHYGFGIFGGLNLAVPGSTAPLSLQYEVTEFNGTVSVIADLSGEIWKDALGIRGLSLDLLEVSTSFSLASPWKSLKLSARAGIVFKHTNIILGGIVKSKTDFSFAANLEHFDIRILADLFERVTGTQLSLPEIDITFGTPSLSLSPGGFSIAFSSIVINGYTSLNAILAISRSGFKLIGDLTASVIQFAGISINKARIEVNFQSLRRTAIALLGDIDFSGINFNVSVYLYKVLSTVEWTVFASLTGQGDSIDLKKFLPGVANTCLEKVSLTKVAFVAASRDLPFIGDNILPSSYVLRKGVQVCAMLGTVDAIKGMVRHDVDGIVLRAAWVSESGFTFGLTVPTNLEIGFNTGIKTTPITIEILTNPVQLRVSAGLKVPVPKQDPLYFSFWLSAGVKGASFTAEMNGNWMNPFGIGQQVRIGNVFVNVGIIYALFVTSGTPSEFGVGGDLQIGNVKATLKLNISEDPQRAFLFAYVSNLSVADLVAFARQVTGKDVPRIQDVIDITINYLSIYICMNGVWIGSKWYPPGFAFSAKMKLWGNHINIMCSVKSNAITIHGGTPSFYVGRIWIHGRNGRSEATFDCTIGSSLASFEVDGAVTVWWWFFGWHSFEVNIAAKVQLYPSFWVSVTSAVRFSLASTRAVALSATGVGAIGRDSSDDLAFAVSGSFEEDLVDHLHREIRKHFELAHRVQLHGFEAVLSSINDEESKSREFILLAEVELENARRLWDEKRVQVVTESEAIIREYEHRLAVVEKAVDDAHNSYQGALEVARIAVQSSTNTRSAKLVDARFEVALARSRKTTAIEEAQFSLDAAIDDMYHAYGNSERDLRHAEQALQRIQARSQILLKERNRLRESPMVDIGDLPRLEAEVISSRAQEGHLDRVIANIKEARTSNDYQMKNSAILSRESELKLTEDRATSAIAAAEENLSIIDTQTAQACEDAKKFSDNVLTGVDYEALQEAIGSLRQFKLENEDSYNLAKEALETVWDSEDHRTDLTAQTKLLMGHDQLNQVLAAKDLLDNFFKEMSEDTLDTAKLVLRDGSIFQIQAVTLSGELHPFLGAEGIHPRPLNAEVNIRVLGNEHTHTSSWHPSSADRFVTDVFKSVWEHLRSN